MTRIAGKEGVDRADGDRIGAAPTGRVGKAGKSGKVTDAAITITPQAVNLRGNAPGFFIHTMIAKGIGNGEGVRRRHGQADLAGTKFEPMITGIRDAADADQTISGIHRKSIGDRTVVVHNPESSRIAGKHDILVCRSRDEIRSNLRLIRDPGDTVAAARLRPRIETENPEQGTKRIRYNAVFGSEHVMPHANEPGFVSKLEKRRLTHSSRVPRRTRSSSARRP
ncbi:MAG TPA: hypothetical protein VF286_14445 [Acidiphilium sp.]